MMENICHWIDWEAQGAHLMLFTLLVVCLCIWFISIFNRYINIESKAIFFPFHRNHVSRSYHFQHHFDIFTQKINKKKKNKQKPVISDHIYSYSTLSIWNMSDEFPYYFFPPRQLLSAYSILRSEKKCYFFLPRFGLWLLIKSGVSHNTRFISIWYFDYIFLVLV